MFSSVQLVLLLYEDPLYEDVDLNIKYNIAMYL